MDPETGLFLRDDNGKPLIVDRTSGDVVAFDHQGAEPDLRGSHNGATSVFTKMIEHFLSPENAPEAVADLCGISAKRIRALAAELAHVAFDQEIRLPQKWTDFRGNTYDEMIGARCRSTQCAGFRPTVTGSKHAARCTHSNHFGRG